jgi:hypothetical protein
MSAILITTAERDARILAYARGAVRATLVGPDLAGEPLERYLAGIEAALTAYAAHAILGVPVKRLARAAETSAAQVRRQLRFVESWRGAPLADQALDALAAALTRSP